MSEGKPIPKIRKIGDQALFQNLGPGGAARFMLRYEGGCDDYIERRSVE